MIRSLLIALLVAASAEAQQSAGSLGDDLRRASSRVFTGGGERSEVDRLAASAAEAFRDEDADRGVQLLDEAAAIAYRTGATTRAFELSLAAAEAQRTAGRLADAAERFQHAALRSAADPRAAAAHRLACEALAAVSNDPKALETYEAALRQHESTWPASETAEACRWDRVGLLARRGQWESVISACQAVDPNEDRYAASRRLLVNAYAKLLDGRETDERFSAALGDLEPLVLGASWRWPTDWTPLQRDAALVLARAHLGRSPEASADAEKYARIALRGRPAPSESWRRSAASLLVVTTLVTGEPTQASEWMAMASDASPGERDELLRATAEAVRRAADRASLLAAADRLTRNVSTLDAEPTDEAKAPATAAQAVALRDAGRLDEARQVYARLAEQRPNDRGVQVAYAELLAASDRPDHAAEAARRWQAIETRTPRSTPDWFAARLGRVRSLARSRQTDEARKLLALTRLLAPSLGDDATRAEFEKLEQTLR